VTRLTAPSGTVVEVPEGIAAVLARKGWQVSGSASPDTPAPLEGAPDESWTVDRLRGYADEHGIDISGLSRKAAILDALLDAGEPAAGTAPLDLTE